MRPTQPPTGRPRHRSLPIQALAVGALLLATLVGGTTATTAAPAASTSPLAGLKILITNDDSAQGHDATFGTDGKGLYELRKALCGAGADVLVVAPWSQQSGAGAGMTTPGFSPVPLTVQAIAPPTAYASDCSGAAAGGAVFGVCQTAGPCSSSTPSATPADAVNVALSRFARTYWPTGPDLVLSGVNFGENVGATLDHSGTVGAVITAHEYGVPAMAFGAEVPHSLAQIPLVPFSQTAAFATDLISSMAKQKKLTSGLVLNVNYPFVGAGEKLGKAVTTVAGTSDDLGLTFTGDVPRTGGTYQLSAGSPTPETRKKADTTALANNDISITPLDGDWTAPSSGGGNLIALLLGLLGL